MSVADVALHLKVDVRDVCPVPPMTDPLGLHWAQPHPTHFLFDDTHVVMKRRHFDQLRNYSASYPTGVYEGKMWKAEVAYMDRQCLPASKWFLCWYNDLRQSDRTAAIQTREILVVD